MSTSNHKFLLEAESRLQAVGQAQAAVNDFANTTSQQVQRVNGGLDLMQGIWVKAAAAITASIYSIKQTWDLAALGAKAEQQARSFENMASAYGVNANQIIRELKRASAGTIDTMELIEKAGTAMMTGIDPEQLSKLMEIARATARQTGQEVSKAFSDIALGVARQSRMILDNLGIVVSVERANESYAAALGKSASQLSETERAQAFLNATVKAGEDLIKKLGDQTKTTSEKMQEFSASIKNIKQFGGETLLLFVEPVLDVLNKISGLLPDVRTPLEDQIRVTERTLERYKSALAGLQKELENLQGRRGFAFSWGATGSPLDAVLGGGKGRIEELEKEIRRYEILVGVVERSLSKLNAVNRGGVDAVAAIAKALKDEAAAIQTSEISEKVKTIASGLEAWNEEQEALDKKLKEAERTFERSKDRVEELAGSIAFMVRQQDDVEEFAFDFVRSVRYIGEVAGEVRQEVEWIASDFVFETRYAERVAEIAGSIVSEIRGGTEEADRDLEHFLDRMQDLFADTFERIRKDGTRSLGGILDDFIGLIGSSGSEAAAQRFREYVFEPMAKGEGTDLAGLFSGGIAGSQKAGWREYGAMAAYGLASGYDYYNQIQAANAAGPTAHGKMSNPTIASANVAAATAAGYFFGGPVGGMLGQFAGQIVSNAIWGEKNLQWGVTGGPKMEPGADVKTAFGRVGVYDKHQDIPEGDLKPALRQFAQYTWLMAENITKAQLEGIAEKMSSWMSDESRDVTSQGLSSKLMDYLKEALDGVGTALADVVVGWEGTLDELYAFLSNRAALIADAQATVDAVIRPLSGAEAINKYWDDLAQALKDAHYEGQILTDIEAARTKQLKDLADAEARAAEAERKRTNELLYAAASAAGAPEWQGAWHYFKQQYGVEFDLGTAKKWYGAFQQNWWNQDLINQTAAAWGMTPGQLTREFERLGRAIASYEESVAQSASGAAESLGTFTGGIDAASSALSTLTGAIASIDDLIFQLTGGSLAPVQSAEFFKTNYARLLGLAQANPENAGALTSFVPQMMQWMNGYGSSYADFASGVIADLQGLRSSYQGQALNIHVHVAIDGREVGYAVANDIRTNPELITAIGHIIETRISGRA